MSNDNNEKTKSVFNFRTDLASERRDIYQKAKCTI